MDITVTTKKEDFPDLEHFRVIIVDYTEYYCFEGHHHPRKYEREPKTVEEITLMNKIEEALA